MDLIKRSLDKDVLLIGLILQDEEITDLQFHVLKVTDELSKAKLEAQEKGVGARSV